jgi:crotonobetainyl-CoA:carnitine CoA-transferase CaiB-like acyl-CoA transferase
MIPFGPVMDIAEIAQDPHFSARAMILPIEQPGSASPISVAGVPIKMTRTPGGVRQRAPLLGEHAVELLRQAGLAQEKIENLIASGAAVAYRADW